MQHTPTLPHLWAFACLFPLQEHLPTSHLPPLFTREAGLHCLQVSAGTSVPQGVSTSTDLIQAHAS